MAICTCRDRTKGSLGKLSENKTNLRVITFAACVIQPGRSKSVLVELPQKVQVAEADLSAAWNLACTNP